MPQTFRPCCGDWMLSWIAHFKDILILLNTNPTLSSLSHSKNNPQGGGDLLGVLGRGSGGAAEASMEVARRHALTCARSSCPLAAACDALAPTAAPRKLPCRDAERTTIDEFVRSVLVAGAE